MNTPLTPTDAAVSLEALVKEYINLKETEEYVKGRLTNIQETLTTTLPVGSYNNIVDGLTVQIRAGAKRLNAAKLAANYPVETHPEMYKTAIDTTSVKNYLAPVELEAFQDHGNPVVVIK